MLLNKESSIAGRQLKRHLLYCMFFSNARFMINYYYNNSSNHCNYIDFVTYDEEDYDYVVCPLSHSAD